MIKLLLVALVAMGFAAQEQDAVRAPEIVRTECPTPIMGPPVYPERLRRRGIGGTTIVRVRADACGRVVDVELGRSSGHDEIDKAVIAAARTWVFTPQSVAKYAGGPIDIPITLGTRR